MKSILELIREQAILADGAIGTELQRMGLKPDYCCELWNLMHSEKVLAIHRAYVEAGAQLITTNSFRGNRFALIRYGLASKAREINRSAAEIARLAAGQSAYVIGSIGPIGTTSSPEDALNAFREQASALIEGGANAIIVETISDTREMEIAVKAARLAGAHLVIASMAFTKVNGSYKTLADISPEQALDAMLSAGVDVVGCNCGAGLTMDDYIRLVELFRSRSDAPIIVQPNAGSPELVHGEIVYKQAPEAMAARVVDLIRSGANIIGGCCGTRPEHIRLFKKQLYSSQTK
jgi:5-methyltetrahydrofolate--homocysteine methyltransferase